MVQEHHGEAGFVLMVLDELHGMNCKRVGNDVLFWPVDWRRETGFISKAIPLKTIDELTRPFYNIVGSLVMVNAMRKK